MVARPTTHAVHTRECCLLIESANLWNEVCAQLHASAIRTRWNAVRRELAPREPRLFAFWFCLILGPASQRRSTLPRHSAVPVATLGSRDSAWFTDHAVVLSGSKSESECKGTRAHAHARRARAREKHTPLKVAQNPINNVLIDCMNSFTTLRRERRQTEVSPSQSLFRFSLNLELSG